MRWPGNFSLISRVSNFGMLALLLAHLGAIASQRFRFCLSWLNTYIGSGCIIEVECLGDLFVELGTEYPYRLNECSRLMTSDK
jgi:hypothetical protein